MTPSKILFYFCVSFIVGIAVESIVKIPQIFVWGILISATLIIFASSLLCKRSFAQERTLDFTELSIIAGFCVLFLVMGILRMQISEFNIANDKLSKLNDQGEIILTGKVITEPDIRDTFQKLKIETDKPKGTVLVTTSRYPEYKYLDKIKITGQLQAPMETDDFSYKSYLMKDGIYSVMNFPRVELLGKENYRRLTSVIYSGILFFKQKLRESIRQNFLPPQSSILEGTILGDNGVMTQDLKNKLNITGLRHVIAVSGTHVVILGSILMSLLLASGFWRGQAFYIAVIFICLYVILTGLPASGVRAGIMGGLYLLAQKLGRQSMGSRMIIMAGAGMLAVNPLLLFYDVGFQLSFLAVLGIIYLEPIIRSFLLLAYKNINKNINKLFCQKNYDRSFFGRFNKIKNGDNAGDASNLIKIASTTFAAQIFTLPIMVYNFGNVSFVSPITNLLVLPVVYWLMVFGFLFSLLGVASHLLGQIFSIPCWILLTYFVKIIDIFSQPWAIKTIENVHWLWLFFSYLFLGFITRFLNKKYSQY